MSAIKTTEKEGDVSIGRHVGIGGNANVRGNVTVHMNVKIEGWLDAKNIKGPDKGLFPTLEDLNQAHPNPRSGWWAIVGKSLPSLIYVAKDGQWVTTGEKSGTLISEDVSLLAQQAVDDLKKKIKKGSADIEALITGGISDMETLMREIPIAQETGDSPTKVMSQDAVTKALGKVKVTTDDGKTLQEVYELTKNTGTTETDVFNLVANTENLCYFTDGRTYKGAFWTSGEKQPIEKIHVLQGKMFCYPNMPAVIFFDAAGQMCGYAGNNTGSGNAVVTYDTSKEGGIPANAVTFQLQGMNTPAEVSKGVAKRIVPEKKMLADIKENVDNFKGALRNPFVKNDVSIPLLTEPLTEERAVYGTSGEVKKYGFWGRTDLISVPPHLILRGRLRAFKKAVPPIVFCKCD